MTTLCLAAPRLITIKNRKALLHHVLDRADAGVRDVVLDLACTRYIDSSGLAMLADLQRVLVREMGGRLRLSGVGSELRLLLHATRLDQRLELVDAADGLAVEGAGPLVPGGEAVPAFA